MERFRLRSSFLIENQRLPVLVSYRQKNLADSVLSFYSEI